MIYLNEDEVIGALATSSPWETAGGAGPLATVVFLRGCILNSFGAVETQINEIAIRASRIPDYHQLSKKVPYTLNDRIEFVEKCFSQGILVRWKSDALNILRDFSARKDLRDQLAHCHLTVLPPHRNSGWEDAWITAKTFSPKRNHMDHKDERIEGRKFLEHANGAKKLAERINFLFCAVREVLPKVVD